MKSIANPWDLEKGLLHNRYKHAIGVAISCLEDNENTMLDILWRLWICASKSVGTLEGNPLQIDTN
jgi:hypothetical protein